MSKIIDKDSLIDVLAATKADYESAYEEVDEVLFELNSGWVVDKIYETGETVYKNYTQIHNIESLKNTIVNDHKNLQFTIDNDNLYDISLFNDTNMDNNIIFGNINVCYIYIPKDSKLNDASISISIFLPNVNFAGTLKIISKDKKHKVLKDDLLKNCNLSNALGTNSIANINSEALGNNSLAFGQGISTVNNGEVAIGRYNGKTVISSSEQGFQSDVPADNLFSIGNGVSNSFGTHSIDMRRNIFEVKESGEVFIEDIYNQDYSPMKPGDTITPPLISLQEALKGGKKQFEAGVACELNPFNTNLNKINLLTGNLTKPLYKAYNDYEFTFVVTFTGFWSEEFTCTNPIFCLEEPSDYNEGKTILSINLGKYTVYVDESDNVTKLEFNYNFEYLCVNLRDVYGSTGESDELMNIYIGRNPNRDIAIAAYLLITDQPERIVLKYDDGTKMYFSGQFVHSSNECYGYFGNMTAGLNNDRFIKVGWMEETAGWPGEMDSLALYVMF